MKKSFLTTAIVLFLFICSSMIQAQTTQNQLNQLELMKQFLGKWQADNGIDTIEVWDCHQYGKAFIIDVTHIIKGQKVPLYINNVGFDNSDGKLKGYSLWPNGNYSTWIALYNSESRFSGDLMNNFNSATIWGKFEIVLVNPKEWTWRTFNMDGVMTSELKFSKAK